MVPGERRVSYFCLANTFFPNSECVLSLLPGLPSIGGGRRIAEKQDISKMTVHPPGVDAEKFEKESPF